MQAQPSPPSPPSQTRTTDILCHANVLCTRSPYFASSLSGAWNEAQTKTVEVVLENDEAVQDMKLLIKLCYSGSYIRDGGELLDASTRIRLAFPGNAFEMQECVSECLESLKKGLTILEALTVLEEVPEELREHEAMAGVTANVIAVLSKALNELKQSDPPTADQKQWKQMIGDALARALGPVDELFGEGSWLKSPDDFFYTCLPLKSHILALSLTVMEALLASDALDVTTENEVYTLLGCWVYQSSQAWADDGIPAFSVAKCLPAFSRLVKFVRFQALSSEFVANVVTARPLATKSDLLLPILRMSLVTRDANSELLANVHGVDSVPLDRGRGCAGWTYWSTLELTDPLALTKPKYLYKCLGLVEGYPVRIEIGPKSRDAKQPSLGIFANMVMPPRKKLQSWEGPRCASFEYSLGVGTTNKSWLEHAFDGSMSWGFSDYFGKPWEEIVREESAYFPGGQTTVEVSMRLSSKGEEEE